MSSDEIVIDQTGLTLLAFPVGLTPTAHDFSQGLGGEHVRSLPPLNARQLQICDAKGLSWLIDVRGGQVLWLDISLSKVHHRRQDEHDPRAVFKGKIRIGNYTIQGCFSFETAEIIRGQLIPGLTVNLIPGPKRIRAINVAFQGSSEGADVLPTFF